MTTALIFDCDGVLAETERDGHRVAFNAVFEEIGLPVRWDPATYGERLKIAGGKERLRSVFTADLAGECGLPTDEDAQAVLIAAWHKRKTEIYGDLVRHGQITARSGVRRLAAAASDAGWRLAVASTSAEPSVQAVLRRAVGSELAAEFAVLAGDIVSRKKPAPDIYLAALDALQCRAGQAVAIEDSAAGVTSARQAGLPCLATLSEYSRVEDLTGACIVLSELGDPGLDPVEVFINRASVAVTDYVRLAHVEAVMEGSRAAAR